MTWLHLRSFRQSMGAPKSWPPSRFRNARRPRHNQPVEADCRDGRIRRLSIAFPEQPEFAFTSSVSHWLHEFPSGLRAQRGHGGKIILRAERKSSRPPRVVVLPASVRRTDRWQTHPPSGRCSASPADSPLRDGAAHALAMNVPCSAPSTPKAISLLSAAWYILGDGD